MRQALRVARTGAWLALILAAQLNAAPAIAGPFSRLQVLLPGETAAPGTSSGKAGSPSAQTAGIPFNVTVNACDASWNLDNTITHTIRILSSDASASLPAAAQLSSGTGQFLVILNAGGTFTIQAHDQSDVTIPDGTSSPVRSIVLQSLEFSTTPRAQTAGTPFSTTITARDPNGDTVVATFHGTEPKPGEGHGDGDDDHDKDGKGHGLQSAKVRPNPLNPQTELSFTLSREGRVRVKIYDMQGRLVKTLLDDFRPVGTQTLTWDGSNASSQHVASGVYFLRIESPEGAVIRRVAVVK